jgi:hypothetical protein
MTGSTRDMQGLLDLVWTHLLPAMQEKTPRSEDAAAQTRLQRELASLTIPLPIGSASSPLAGEISGKTFSLEPNRLDASSVSFEFGGGTAATFKLKRANGVSELRCGFGRWLENHTAVFAATPVKTAAAGAWKNERTFEMQWLFSMGHGTLICEFDGDAVSISFPPPEAELLLTGRMSASL